jgi:A/G-specific adenine glycosylase
VTTSGSNHVVDFRRALRRIAPSIERELPWINHDDPWAILVSEFMLQQTQVSRVVVPWSRFLAAFPTPSDCADAPLSEVLRLWAGLGYHRRAKALHGAASMIRDDFAGEVPHEVDQLRSLPGVGEYTANAVASFAFGQRVAIVDTNVGRVLARALANRSLSTSEARNLAKDLLGRSDSAPFNQALLDLGAQYCKSTPLCAACPVAPYCRWHREGGVDPALRSAAVSQPQSRFVGSDRQLRGTVLKVLRDGPRTKASLFAFVDDADGGRREAILDGLVRDGLVQRRGRNVQLVGD